MKFKNRETGEVVEAIHAKEGVEGRGMDGAERRAELGDWLVTLADSGEVLMSSPQLLDAYEYQGSN